MTAAADSGFTIRYEGPGTGTEIWGMTQANFSLGIPGRHAKECAILLNDAAAAYIAKELGREDVPEERQALATAVGIYLLEQRAAAGGHIDSVVTVSVALLQEHPDIIEHLRTRGG